MSILRGTIGVLGLDMDGTLLDTGDIKVRAYHEAMENVAGGSREAHETAYRRHGTINRERQLILAFQDVVGRAPTGEESGAMTAAYTAFYRQHMDEITVFPDFCEFYERFRGRIRFLIASNAPRDEVVELCEMVGIDGCFDRIDGHPVAKSAALLGALVAYDARPETLLYVGDRTEDGIAADEAGVRFCLIDHTGAGVSERRPCVRSFTELGALLEDDDPSHLTHGSS